ncbi:hypothetical protein ACFXJ8_39265 [Nonomuraea sp. NPDC059194]|uniref:hypothetical protein n=1 Tax=Nonomuraea sp. NPDC059194 TaxID=3346764 RepID=UPI00368FE70C
MSRTETGADWPQVFLAELGKHGYVNRAAKAAGVTNKRVYARCREDRDFADALEAARAVFGRDNRRLRPGWTATPYGYLPPGETYTGPSWEEAAELDAPLYEALEKALDRWEAQDAQRPAP